jgi:hypothetical protein
VIAIAGINDDALASLPGKCGVPFPMITGGRTLDCNTYISYHQYFYFSISYI